MSDHQSNNTDVLGISRRALLAGASGVGTLAFAAATPARAAIVNSDFRNCRRDSTPLSLPQTRSG